MAYPTSFGTLPDAQSLGAQSINVYGTVAALASETGVVPQGAIAAVQQPSFQLLQANQTAGSSYVCTSTSSTQYAAGGVVTYWTPIGASNATGQGTPFTARAASLAIAAYAGSGTGTLTASATGALAAQDGITLAAGDQLFLPPGLTNVTAKDSGPWVVITPGGSGVKYVLSRPAWFAHGSQWQCGQQVKIGGEGAFFQNTTWRVTGTPGAITYTGVIDTVDAGFYVERFTFSRKLVAGTLVLAAGQPVAAVTSATFPVGVYSATQSNIHVAMAIPAGTLTGTVSYGPTNASSTALATAGYGGTAAGAVFALATAQATQTNDVSTLNITVLNF